MCIYRWVAIDVFYEPRESLLLVSEIGVCVSGNARVERLWL